MKKSQKLILMLLLLPLILTVYSCKSNPSKSEKTTFNLKYELAEDEELEAFYVSDTKIYATVNKIDTTNMSAPTFGTTTQRFIIYDFVNDELEKQYDIEERGVYIYHAIPFQDGIIYSVYTPNGTAEVSDTGFPWEIRYISDERNQVIDSGFCSNMIDMLPGFSILDEEVYYLYEDMDEDTGYSFGIKKADLDNSQVVVQETEKKLSETEFYSNGTDYAILVDAKILIGNTKGIYREYDLPEKISSYGICKDYLFCCTTSDGSKWAARSINLETGKEYVSESDEPLYRVTSMRGMELTCVLENWEMCILQPGKNYKVFPLDSSDDLLETRRYVIYYPYDETKTLAQLDSTKFCRIIW